MHKPRVCVLVTAKLPSFEGKDPEGLTNKLAGAVSPSLEK